MNPLAIKQHAKRVLLIAGSADDVVPPEMVKAFALDNNLPFCGIENMGHRVGGHIDTVVEQIKASLTER